jgi:deazaflavin-dependent oxidoreductase (nitroreductase family)
MPSTSNPSSAKREPPWIMREVVDLLTVLLVGRLGMDDHNGTRVLEVKGRKTGLWRATPVRLLELDGRRYLVAMYGNSRWVRNLRAQGAGRLRLGSDVTEFRAVELAGTEQVAVLRAYLKRWWSLVARITTVTSPDASDEELAKAAPMHPAFRLD